MISLTAQHQRSIGLDAAGRDAEAFRAWYDEVMPRVYRYLAVRCEGDAALAEELTQQTFIAAIRDRDRFDHRSDAVTWLCAIGRHKLVDHYRRAGRARRGEAALVALQPAVAERWVARSDERVAVSDALATLHPDHRLALIFRYLDDLPVREVATAIGRSESATESLLTRAREAFRRAYGDQTDA
jgi:RNA polymerase sigma-70 factor (ECF subfamily)